MNSVREKDFQLGQWVVTPKLNSVSRNGHSVRLEPKVMQVLLCLAEAGDVVSKEKLMASVWPGTFVTDDVLTRSISELRKVFEDDPKEPRFIQTLPKAGYRLLVPVEDTSGNGSAAPVHAKPELQAPPRASQLPRRLVALPALAVALVALLLAILVLKYISSATAVPTRATMLAVLPFQNLNSDSSQDYFADGLTAEMISQLGRLPSDRIGVIAWSSMVRYKGVKQSEDEIGRALGANYILEGTVRRVGQRVRITAELLKTGNRSHIWADSFEGDLSDVLAVQTSVAREIASEIQLRLTPEQQARLQNPGQVNPEGYDAYLRSNFMLPDAAVSSERFQQLQKAIQLTPGYAPPYVALSMYYKMQASFGFAPSQPTYSAARSAIENALRIDPNLASAHREMAWILWRGEWNFRAADREFRRALELNPGEAQTHEQYSLYLKSEGKYEDALREIDRCLELSPLESISHANAGTVLGLLGRYDASISQFGRGIQLDPRDPYVRERMGAVLLWQGQTAQAIDQFEKAVELSGRHPEKLAWLGYAYSLAGNRQRTLDLLDEIKQNPRHQYVSPFYVAMLYSGLADKENAFAWLEKAYSEHDEWMVYLRIYPEFAALRGDSRFRDLERRVGLS